MTPIPPGITASTPFKPEFTPVMFALLGLIFVLLLALSPLLARLLCRLFRLEKPNFRNDRIPAAVGIGFLIVAVFVYGALAATDAPLAASAPVFLVTAAGFGLLGLFDDLYGTRAVGGFRGHLRSLATARPTTGALKMIGGGFVALAASFFVNGGAAVFTSHHPLLVRFVLDAAIIALSANAINLLDVRPGRGQFGFLLLCLPTLFAVLHQGIGWIEVQPPPAVLLGPIVLAALTEWWPDSRGSAMMGDTGSNLLGAVAGLAAVTILPLSGSFFLFAALLTLNWLSEKVSLTELIQRTPLLRKFDGWLGVR